MHAGAIDRIDAARHARAVGQMLVTEAEIDSANPERVLVDVQALDGRELLDAYRKRHSQYGTAPFDPEGKLLRFYPGGVTIWSGFPGTGKSSLLRQTVCHFLARGSYVFVASLEEDPSDVLVRMAATASACIEPTAHQLQYFIDIYGARFRLWGRIGIAEHRQLLGTVTMLAKQGMRHAVIDSLMCLDVANDDFEGQRKFANLLSATARAAKIHVHLVAHPRKLQSSDQEPDLNDVAGAREIGGIADNVLFVRRSKSSDYGPTSPATGMSISIRKQRHFSGALADIAGWHQRASRHFTVEQFPAAPIRYLPQEAFQ